MRIADMGKRASYILCIISLKYLLKMYKNNRQKPVGLAESLEWNDVPGFKNTSKSNMEYKPIPSSLNLLFMMLVKQG